MPVTTYALLSSVKKIKLNTAATLLICSFSSPNLLAENFTTKIDALLNEHNLMLSAQQNLNAAKARVSLEKAGWYPNLSINGDIGRDQYYRSNASNSDLDTSSVGVTFKQLVWDFGTINSGIDKTKRAEDQAQTEVTRQRQRLILAAIEAEKNLLRAIAVHEFSEATESYVKKQTNLETTKIQMGSGYTSDLLQAKSQLAAAQAKKSSDAGSLAQARHRYQSLFGDTAIEPEKDDFIVFNRDLIPASLDQAVELTIQYHPDILVSHSNLAVAQADVRKTQRSGKMPTIHFVAKYVNDHNPDGADFDREQKNIGLEFRWDQNLGGRSNSGEKVSSFTAAKVEQEFYNAKKQAIEDTRNIWNQLQIAKARSNALSNQSEIIRQFLDLARKESELGKRSSLDVLSSETALINAKSDSAAALIDISLAEFRLLYQIGKLDLPLFN